MFVGFQDYTVSREMGERTPLPKRQAPNTEYRPSEMGEYNVPSRAQQQEYYNKAEASYSTYPATARRDDYRPREMGEAPVGRNNREMTEQEKRLDLFA